MALKGKYNINIYGAAVTGAAALRAYLFQGDSVLDVTGKNFDQLPTVLGAEHQLDVSVEVPNGTFPVGVSVDLDITMGTTKLLGFYDLVYMDGVSYLGGLRLNIKANGSVEAIPE